MQASDVSHTMQHWHVYRKWNKRLFLELYQAHKVSLYFCAGICIGVSLCPMSIHNQPLTHAPASLLVFLPILFQAGRMAANPAAFWYGGELGFFDNYIIPLAKKLKDCGVFGVSSDECLNYALQNRAEWEARGKAIVQEMLDEVDHEEKSPVVPNWNNSILSV